MQTLASHTVWLASETRLGLVSHLRKAIVEIRSPIKTDISLISNHIFSALVSRTKSFTSILHFSGQNEGTIDLVLFPDQGAAAHCLCLQNLELDFAARLLPGFLNRPRPRDRIRDVTVDLRRVALDPPPSATLVHLRAVVTEAAINENLHGSAESVEVTFRAASDEVAKVVEDLVASARSTHPTHRCRVLKD